MGELEDSGPALFPERLVAGGQDFIEEEDVGIDGRRDGEAEPRAHPRGIGLDRSVDELTNVGEADDPGRPIDHLAVIDAHERARQHDVVPSGQLLVEAGPELQEARDMTANVDAALRWRDDPRERLEEGALARPVGTDDREGLAVDEPKAHVAQGPERSIALTAANDRGKRLAEGVLLREPEVVANAELPNLDRVFGWRRDHYRTLAKAGSSRLKKMVANTTKTRLAASTTSNIAKFGSRP